MKGTDKDKYLSINIPSHFPGNISFIMGPARKNNPKVHGIAINIDSFIDN